MKKTTMRTIIWRTAFLLIGLVLLTSHFTQKIAARYVSENGTAAGARVASFHGGIIELETIKYPEVTLKESSGHIGTFAFLFEFDIVFTNETKSTYGITLKTSASNRSSFTCIDYHNAGKWLSISRATGAVNTTGATPESIGFNGSATNFAAEEEYYYITSGDADRTADFNVTVVSSQEIGFELKDGKSVDFNETHTFQIILFTYNEKTDASTVALSPLNVDWEIHCEQVD